MGYVVYEDDPTRYARVHQESCRKFVYRKPQTRDDNRWHCPFDTLEAAFAKAKSVKPLKFYGCKFCKTHTYLTD